MLFTRTQLYFIIVLVRIKKTMFHVKHRKER
nr:MAG TPA: hypothetical protein [Caudoviricetes sp.]